MTGPYGDDRVLVDALRRRDQSAFAWLLDRYDPSLRRVARTFLSDRDLVDDVVQETWVAVIRGIDRFEGRSSLKTWLFRILVNISRTRGAREARVVPASFALGDDVATFDPSRFQGSDGTHPRHWLHAPASWDEQPDGLVESAATLAVIREAIDRLPPGQRAVMTLRDVEGWSASEVCSLLVLTEVNQRVLLHRARARVRQAVEDHLAEVVR